MSFDFCKLFFDVFHPQVGEIVTFMVDEPHEDIKDLEAWIDRRKMAVEWQDSIAKMANKWQIKVNPLVYYDATGAGNRDLPQTGLMDGRTIDLSNVILSSTIVISMPQFSATAPLLQYTKQSKKLRVASMPTVERRMQKTGLAADYVEVARRCSFLQPIFDKAIGSEVVFSTGQRCYFDLRFRKAHKDDGMLSLEAISSGGQPLCNLPAGEVYQAPYEGEKQGVPSETCGELPVKYGEELVIFKVKENEIVEVVGDGENASKMRKYFEVDDARRNIAEFAVGCNDKAIVAGNMLEDEKAGFHWAYGRSEHLGGVTDVKSFKNPTNVVHDDMIYAAKSPIIAKRVDLVYENGENVTVVKDGNLLI